MKTLIMVVLLIEAPLPNVASAGKVWTNEDFEPKKTAPTKSEVDK